MNIKKHSGDKAFARQLAEQQKKALLQCPVVNLVDYKNVTRNVDPYTILVIDDEIVMRNAIKRIFEKGNFKVLGARDAQEFSQIIADTTPDIVLLDIGLPWVNGYELCRLLKSHAVLSSIPIVIISGNKTEEDIRKGFEMGADEYVTKPFEVDELYDIVIKLLNKKERA